MSVQEEKVPLLPMTEECQKIECYKNKIYKKKYKRQTILLFLCVVFFFIHQDIYDFFNPEVTQDLVTNILEFNENQMMSTDLICHTKPMYSTFSNFQFNSTEFPELSINQKTNQGRGRSISIIGGEAIVLLDKRISKVKIDFEFKFNIKELQDKYWIDKVEQNGRYALTIRSDGTYVENACVTIDFTVRLPTLDSIQVLDISLANSGIIMKQGLIFEQLALAVANGHIDFSEGISSAQTGFVAANGHISGIIDDLSDELHVSTANGYTDIDIKNITTKHIIPLHLSTANGKIDLKVPTSFKSTFSLKSFRGRRSVDSSIPKNIHMKSNGWGEMKGYYGDNEEIKNSIVLSSSNGGLHLTYK